MTITTKEVRTLDVIGKEMTIEAITRSPQGEIKQGRLREELKSAGR